MARVLRFTACAAAVGMALYGAAGYWGVPWGIRTVLEKVVSAKLERPVSLAGVSFNPWSWTLDLKGLSIPETGSEPLLSLDHLVVDLSSSSLLRLAPVVDEVTVEGLHVNAVANEANRRLVDRLAGTSGKTEADGAKAPSSGGSGDLPQFAVRNISVSGSSFRYRDAERGIDQSISDLSLNLPFLSTMATSTESLVTPALSFKLNGAAIEATGSTRPFGSTLEAKLALHIRGLDVAGIARIVPALDSRKLRVDSANLSTNLAFTFRNATNGKPAKMLLSGETVLSNIAVSGNGKQMAALSRATLDLSELDLVGRNVAVKNIALSGLRVNAERSASGINLLAATGDGSAAAATGSAAPVAKEDAAWTWSVGTAGLSGATINWTDGTVKPAAKVTAGNLNVSARNLSSARDQPGSFSISADVLGGRLEASGTAGVNPLAVETRLKGSRLTLNALAPYITQTLHADLRSGVGFDVTASISGTDVAASGTASVTDLRLRQGRTNLVTLKNGTLKVAGFDTAKRSADLSLVSLEAPVVNAVLTKNGLNLTGLGGSGTTADKTGTKAGAGTASTSSSTAGAAWSWRVAEAKVSGGVVHFTDETLRPAARTDVSRIAFTAKSLSSRKDSTGTVSLSCALGGGSLNVAGKAGVTPLVANMEVEGRGLGLKSFSPFLTGRAGIGAKSGTFDATGRLTLSDAKAGGQLVGWKGDMSLSDLALTNTAGRSLMSWKKAALTGMEVETSEPPRLIIAQAEIEQPAQKATKAAKELSGLASLVSSLSGRDKTATRIDRLAGKLDATLVLKDIRLENGRFSAAGVSAASIEGLLLQKLSDTMGAKLGASKPAKTTSQ